MGRGRGFGYQNRSISHIFHFVPVQRLDRSFGGRGGCVCVGRLCNCILESGKILPVRREFQRQNQYSSRYLKRTVLSDSRYLSPPTSSSDGSCDAIASDTLGFASRLGPLGLLKALTGKIVLGMAPGRPMR